MNEADYKKRRYKEMEIQGGRYKEMEIQGAKRQKAAALYLAGYDKAAISKRLSLAPAMVDLYIDRMKGEIKNAERKL